MPRGVIVFTQGEKLHKSDVGLVVVDTCTQVTCVSVLVVELRLVAQRYFHFPALQILARQMGVGSQF